MGKRMGEMVAKPQTPKNPELADFRSPLRDAKGQLTLDLSLDPSLVEADFIVSSGNQMAFNRVINYLHWPDPMTLITGAPKIGKSHLARIWLGRSHAVMADAENMEQLAEVGGDHPVLIEDADRVAYPESAFFHLLNQSMRDRRPILLTARAPVAKWPYETADVLSRVRLAAHFEVEMPDDIQLSHMFVKLFGDRQVTVDPKVIAYLVARMERSPKEVVALVALMDDLALSKRAPITRNIAVQALEIRTDAAANTNGDFENE